MSAWDSEAWRGIIDCGIIAAAGAALHAIAWVHERRASRRPQRLTYCEPCRALCAAPHGHERAHG